MPDTDQQESSRIDYKSMEHQRFLKTFLTEVDNVLHYALSMSDALNTLVNIVGKVMQVNRCLILQTEGAPADWKCYEYWQQDRVQSCIELGWSIAESSLVAEILISELPLTLFYEGDDDSEVSTVQAELRTIGAKSIVAVILRSEVAVHGCLILQQCDERRVWLKDDIDFFEKIADKISRCWPWTCSCTRNR